MYNFKEFFSKNYDFQILLEAVRGRYSKKPVLYDNEDLDFLYQLDQKDWISALKARYMKAWELLRSRQKIRSSIIKEMLSYVKQSNFLQTRDVNGKKQRKFLIDTNNINEFKKFLLDLGDKYDSYGNKTEVADPSEINKRKVWLDILFDEYDIESVSTRGSIDNQRAIRDLIYEIVKRIVIYVKGGDDEKYTVNGRSIKFYINRFIQKLETTKGEEHHLKTNLENLSKIYGKEINFEKSGRYGFDLSSPKKIRTIEGNKKITVYGSGVVKDGRIYGYIFPKENSIKDSLNRLLVLNYQRHLPNKMGSGDLPTDSPEHGHEITYKIIRSKKGQITKFEDKFAFNSYKTNFSNYIKRFLDNNENIEWTSFKLEPIFEGSVNPEQEKEEMESGIWLVKYILGKSATEEEISNSSIDNKLKQIFHNNYEKEIEPFKKNGKLTIDAIRNATNYSNVRKNRKLKDMFCEYFAKIRATNVIKSQVEGVTPIYGPKILGYLSTGDAEKDAEIMKKELELLDDKDKEELKNILGDADWEKFVKTGRLPYKIDEKKKKILVGKFDPPIILPHITMGSGPDKISFPLINPGSYISQLGILDPKREREINRIKKSIESKIDSDESLKNLNLDSIQDLEFLKTEIEKKQNIKVSIKSVDKLIEFLKRQEIAEKNKVTTPRSSSIVGANGEPVDQVVKFHRTNNYGHGKKGTILPGHRPVSGGFSPSAPSWAKTKIGYYKIFPMGSVVMGGSSTLIDDKTWRSVQKLFDKRPELKPEEIQPMKMKRFKISSSALNFEESIDLSKFQIIKEAEEEDRTAEGAKKGRTGQSFIHSNSKNWINIEPTKNDDDPADITGWNDIIKGINKSLLEGKFGSYEGEYWVKKYLLEPENLEKLHDDIVYEFYNNATDPSLYTHGGRQSRAASIVGILLQSKFKGAEARKRRTGSSKPIKKEEPKEDVSINTIKIMDRDFFKNIFIDFKRYQEFDLPNGKQYVPRIMRTPGGKPESFTFRGYKPYNADSEENIEDYLNNYSQILGLQIEKINEQNAQKIKEIIEKEKNTLLEYWNEVFPKIREYIEKSLSTLGITNVNDTPSILKYLSLSDTYTKKRINDLYSNKINLIENKYKELTAGSAGTQPNILNTNIEIEKGINEISEFIEDVNKTLKDFDLKISTIKIPPKTEKSSTEWKPSFKHKELPIKYDKNLHPMLNWYNMIVSTLKYMGHSVDHDPANLRMSLLKFLGIQRGGISSLRTNDLRFSVHLFLDKLDDNINNFIKIVNTNLDSLPIPDKNKKVIKDTAPALNGLINKLKQNLIKILSEK